jgi:Txe/YoeB family toxin of Txe-Axe toxin-antitoxin module
VPALGGPYRLRFTPEAQATWDGLELNDQRKWKKVNKALQHLAQNPRHPGLGTHKWETLKGKAPDGGDMWAAYIENNTPSAWRIFFYYPGREPGFIHVTSIEPHPED